VVRVKVSAKRSGYVDKTGRVKIAEYYSVAVPKQLAWELGIEGVRSWRPWWQRSR
jgi:hypothetical protein